MAFAIGLLFVTQVRKHFRHYLTEMPECQSCVIDYLSAKVCWLNSNKMSAEQTGHIDYNSFVDIYRIERLRITDPIEHEKFIRSQWEFHAKKLHLLFGWNGTEASLIKFYKLSITELYHQIANDFQYEDFKPHFIPVWGRELVPIPWIGSLNELAEMVLCLGKIERLIMLQHKVRVQIQKHFTWNGCEIDNGSVANALSSAGKIENYTKSRKIINQIY